MSNIELFMQNAVPFIKNASWLTSKLVSMQVGEMLEISPSQLPKSYAGIKTFINRLSRKYGLYFAIVKLDSNIGWRVMRVKDIAELNALTPTKANTKAVESASPLRHYNMSDPELAAKVVNIITRCTKDMADLAPRGVTAARVAALKAMNVMFRNFDDDIVMKGNVALAVDVRENAYTFVTDKIGNLRTMAQNAFGIKSLAYGRFGFEGMISANNKDLVHLCERAYREAIKEQAVLQAEGFTVAFDAILKAAITDFDLKRDAVITAEHDRKQCTKQRVELGNTMYAELEKICNTGKDVYRMLNPAKMKPYFIYDGK